MKLQSSVKIVANVGAQSTNILYTDTKGVKELWKKHMIKALNSGQH